MSADTQNANLIKCPRCGKENVKPLGVPKQKVLRDIDGTGATVDTYQDYQCNDCQHTFTQIYTYKANP